MTTPLAPSRRPLRTEADAERERRRRICKEHDSGAGGLLARGRQRCEAPLPTMNTHAIAATIPTFRDAKHGKAVTRSISCPVVPLAQVSSLFDARLDTWLKTRTFAARGILD